MIKKIIIVDDSATARMIIKRCLEIAGFLDVQVIEANDGQEALGLAEENQPDLLITDLNMPNMDGRTLLKRFKASPRLNPMPVLIISSASNEAVEKELVELGALAVVNKPITPTSVSEALQNINEENNEDQWG
ncbi:MAG: response regulator [Candidatus Poribacteria bacterium]